MENLDPRTVVLLAGVMSGFMAMVMFSLKRSYPVTIQGWNEWGTGLLMVAVGSLLAVGLGSLPDFFSISLPRLLFPMGLFLSYVGVKRFFGETPRWTPWLVLIAITVVAQMWFTFRAPDYAARLRLSGALAVVLFAAFIDLVRRQGLTTFARILTMGVLCCMGVIVAARLAITFIWQQGANIYDATPEHMVYLSALSVFILLLAVSLVLLASERLHSEIGYLASHDSLTNALTRRHMREVCAIELERSQRHDQRSLAFMIIDLDHFKAINDTYGHLRGDKVLVDFVTKVNLLLRRQDQLARFGGEEFVVLLPETSLDEALSVAECIRSVCAQPGTEPSCTVSIGVTTNVLIRDTVDSLVARADTAMYRAKALGRNRVEAG